MFDCFKSWTSRMKMFTRDVWSEAEIDGRECQQLKSYKRSISDRCCREKQLDLIEIEIERNSPSNQTDLFWCSNWFTTNRSKTLTTLFFNYSFLSLIASHPHLHPIQFQCLPSLMFLLLHRILSLLIVKHQQISVTLLRQFRIDFSPTRWSKIQSVILPMLKEIYLMRNLRWLYTAIMGKPLEWNWSKLTRKHS